MQMEVDEAPRARVWEWIIGAAIVAGLAASFYSGIVVKVIRPVIQSMEPHDWPTRFARPSLLWAIAGAALVMIRTALWLRYKPTPSATMADAPSLTVIIPAYNEGAMVGRTIDSVASASYPRDRLEILVVDDGSTDDTWEHIERAAAKYPGLVRTHRFPENRGKRAGLDAGFRSARGEVTVSIDSDSVIEPGTLLALAGPFRDPKVGAVAGKVSVLNRREGIIPRMLHVRFVLSFDFIRAAQSVYRTVTCCPGALAAYRTSVVREILDAWLEQTFLGVACTYGEDRAMTNFILGRGYDTLYQRTAVVHTLVPTTYAKLCKMYLRWDRSYVREEIRFAKIVWTRPLFARAIAVFDAAITVLGFPVGYACLALLAAAAVRDPLSLLRFLGAMGVMSLFGVLYFLRSERSGNFVFGVVYSYFSLALLWVFPYALLTVRSRSWMTR